MIKAASPFARRLHRPRTRGVSALASMCRALRKNSRVALQLGSIARQQRRNVSSVLAHADTPNERERYKTKLVS